MSGSAPGDEDAAEAVTWGVGHEVREVVDEVDGSGRDGGGGAPGGTEAGGAEAGGTEAAGSVTPGVSEAGATEGARPGDIAREALRAARDEAKRARTAGGDAAEAATGVVGRGVGAKRGARTRPGKASAGGTRGRRSGASAANSEGASRAQELRELLAGAFQLPPEVSDPGLPAHPADDGSGGRPLAHPEGEVDATTADATFQAPAGGSDPLTPGLRTHTRPGSRGAVGDAVNSVAEQLGYRATESRTPDSPTSATPSPEPLRPDPSPEPSGPQPTASEKAPEVSEAKPDARPPHPESQPDPHAESQPDRRPAPGRPAPANPALGERLPRSMASPGRDGELRRTFPRFPARDAVGGAFAETWWGNAWVTALEEGALDAGRLARGRTYAGQGHVDAITVTPGLVLAYVHGSRPRPYRVQIRVRTLADADWDRFLDAAAERPGHIAALLDKEMPKSLAECGVDLLPGPGELEPHCSCPDFGHPCKHAAALCYQTARLLDQDPFVLLLLRGRGERELLDALSRRNATRAARASQEREPAPLPGVRARDVLTRRVLPPLPVPLQPPAHPEQPPAYPGAPGGPDPFALDQLATDAAARAHALLTAGRDPVADLTLWQDAVRIAAARPGSGLTAGTRALYASLATATRRTPSDLARAVAAWRQGGFDALAVLEEPWDPPAGRFDRARPLLLAADLPAFRPWRNHLTHPGGHAQLRLGRNGLWYAFESEPGQDDWWPRGTPDLDPVGALTGLGAPGDL
ncbi:SWIM zinc finger family protein [Streptomyces sp. NPDC048643]|uniref:SWIM zinc finger family protein n=1 Tax=Streptomyces sp. NPDC048643 TaxID=3155637 RepID=UPI003445BEE2